MPRRARPWYREQTGWWMVYLDGEAIKLVQGPKDEHYQQLAEEKLVEERKLRRQAPGTAGQRVVDLVEAYLRYSRANLSEDTHRVNRYYGQSFAEHCGTVPALEIRPFHVTEWVTRMQSPDRVEAERLAKREQRAAARKPGEKAAAGADPRPWGEATTRNARPLARRVFSWAVGEGLVAVNPLAGMKVARPGPRNRALSEKEFRTLYDNADGPFRDLLLTLWETGARPKEVRTLRNREKTT
jgi:integrase